jgi:hypothetical protein
MSAIAPAKPGDWAVVGTGVGVEPKESVALYESIIVPFSYASYPTSNIWLFCVTMNGVPTVFVAFASMGTVTLLDGSPIHDRMVMGLPPVLLTMIVSRSPAQFGDENILRGDGTEVLIDISTLAVGSGVGR